MTDLEKANILYHTLRTLKGRYFDENKLTEGKDEKL